MKTNQQLPRMVVVLCVLFATVSLACRCGDGLERNYAGHGCVVQRHCPRPLRRIVQLAVFEAVNTIVGGYKPYLGTVTAPPGASPEAAAIAAAHRALVVLYPSAAASLDAAEALSLSAIPNGQAKTDGIAVGEAAAVAILTLRANDGSNPPSGTPGHKSRRLATHSTAYLPALLPGWGQVTTFGIKSGMQFRSAPPPNITRG